MPSLQNCQPIDPVAFEDLLLTRLIDSHASGTVNTIIRLIEGEDDICPVIDSCLGTSIPNGEQVRIIVE